jgi:hypothetical protein
MDSTEEKVLHFVAREQAMEKEKVFLTCPL